MKTPFSYVLLKMLPEAASRGQHFQDRVCMLYRTILLSAGLIVGQLSINYIAVKRFLFPWGRMTCFFCFG